MSNFSFAQKSAFMILGTAAVATMMFAAPAMAEEEGGLWSVEAAYTADVIGPVAGDSARRGSVLDNFDLVGDLDLGRAIGWDGAVLHGYLLSNNGDIPNDVVGSLQGVDNIEVGRQDIRLYELWIQAPLGERTTVLAGLYDLNSEFYANDAAGLLIAPSFGIGSELAATGPNGPSIFPSTALAVRINHEFDNGYVRGAVLNAHAGVPGDTGGVDVEFDGGALVIAEAGFTGGGKFAVGAWRYTDHQDDIRDLTPLGDPVRRTSQGAYILAERVLWGAPDDGGRVVTGFLRAGISDGSTSPFKGGWQAGVLVERVFASRPDGVLSIGLQQGALSSRMRANLIDEGVDAADAESGLEITYSDRLTDRITLQPDLQVIFDNGGASDAGTVVVLGLRLTVDLLP